MGDGGAYASASGVVITEHIALTNPVVNDCVGILKDAVGQVETVLYDRAGADGSERERSRSALAYRLRQQPNDDQTAIEFKREMQQAASFHDFAYGEIEWRGADPVNIWPRHPARIRVEVLAGGRKRYGYLEDDHTTWRPILPQDMLRVPGRPVLRYAGETIGRALALERYQSRLFGRGVKPSALISTDPSVNYTKAARDLLRDSIESEHGGTDRAGGVLILTDGLKYTQMGMTNQEAEYSALLSGITGDLARFWRIPPYMVGLLESGTVSYASVNTQGADFVVYCLMPWLVGWEQAMQRDLIVDKRGQFVEFLTASLMRGTTKERYEVYAIAIDRGIMSPNDARRLENMNARPGGDAYRPLDLGTTTGPRHVEAGSPADRLLQALTSDAAANVLRRETGALARLAERAGPDARAWEAGVSAFYDSHPAYVAEKLKLPLTAAVAWSEQQRWAVLSEGPAIVSTWNGDRSERLAQMALREGAPEVTAA